MPIMKYRPVTDFEDIGSGLRLFQDTVNRMLSEPTARPWAPPVDIFETENELLLKADLPGVEMKDIDIQFENGTLALRASASTKTNQRRRLPPDRTKLRVLRPVLRPCRTRSTPKP